VNQISKMTRIDSLLDPLGDLQLTEISKDGGQLKRRKGSKFNAD
jgi:hypothetical protein